MLPWPHETSSFYKKLVSVASAGPHLDGSCDFLATIFTYHGCECVCAPVHVPFYFSCFSPVCDSISTLITQWHSW